MSGDALPGVRVEVGVGVKEGLLSVGKGTEGFGGECGGSIFTAGVVIGGGEVSFADIEGREACGIGGGFPWSVCVGLGLMVGFALSAGGFGGGPLTTTVVVCPAALISLGFSALGIGDMDRDEAWEEGGWVLRFSNLARREETGF